VIQAEMKANARSMIGGEMGRRIANAIGVRKQKKQRRGSFGMTVGITRLKAEQFIHTSKSGRQSNIVSAIEYGHGSAAAIPFARKAWEAKKVAALWLMMWWIDKGLQIEAAKP